MTNREKHNWAIRHHTQFANISLFHQRAGLALAELDKAMFRFDTEMDGRRTLSITQLAKLNISGPHTCMSYREPHCLCDSKVFALAEESQILNGQPDLRLSLDLAKYLGYTVLRMTRDVINMWEHFCSVFKIFNLKLSYRKSHAYCYT
ncbi:hypothetical protein CDAR_560071 [Caerostris darwini]|uniref:Uncharacterized protein n=1 Tax=Caerostris darwini TaxID=1538125 RepID=A0AAV4VZ96_9ARAC|nr:hypothetical protein CDAR_560071 [Caerostris darwini]